MGPYKAPKGTNTGHFCASGIILTRPFQIRPLQKLKPTNNDDNNDNSNNANTNNHDIINILIILTRPLQTRPFQTLFCAKLCCHLLNHGVLLLQSRVNMCPAGFADMCLSHVKNTCLSGYPFVVYNNPSFSKPSFAKAETTCCEAILPLDICIYIYIYI